MTIRVNRSKKELHRYIQLVPTTFYLVPDCFGASKPDITSEKCWLCPVKKQCDNKQETVMR